MKRIIFERTADVKMPCKVHKTDAGLDFYIPNDIKYLSENGKNIVLQNIDNEMKIAIGAHDSVLIPMGVKSKFEEGNALVFFNRSGIASKKHLFRGACIVDSEYRGTIFVNLTNVSDEVQYLQPGEKLIQAMLLPVPEIEVVEDKVENDTERGEGGFGSTNNK